MAKLFGFSIEDTEPLSPNAVSPVPPNQEDGNDHYLSSGFFGQYVDIEGVYRTEFDLIKRYREMALHPEADSAIEDIVNEALVSDSNDQPVQINLDHLNASLTLVLMPSLALRLSKLISTGLSFVSDTNASLIISSIALSASG